MGRVLRKYMVEVIEPASCLDKNQTPEELAEDIADGLLDSCGYPENVDVTARLVSTELIGDSDG